MLLQAHGCEFNSRLFAGRHASSNPKSSTLNPKAIPQTSPSCESLASNLWLTSWQPTTAGQARFALSESLKGTPLPLLPIMMAVICYVNIFAGIKFSILYGILPYRAHLLSAKASLLEVRCVNMRARPAKAQAIPHLR